MRILSTFNDKIYNLSGKSLLDSVEENVPEAEVWIYEDVSEENIDDISSRNLNLQLVKIRNLPEFSEVFNNNKDVIDVSQGGLAKDLGMWNERWFGWFHKVLMQYDAVVRKRYKGVNVFLDADARIIKPIPESFVGDILEKPVGLFQGDRDSVEAGVVVVDGLSGFAIEFYNFVMSIYTNQNFRRLPRWDDSFILAKSRERWPHLVQDFAEGVSAANHVNSNGHSTSQHVIPFTRWGMYIEHDKGSFLRSQLSSSSLDVPK
jgi:hypothetical protein